MHGLSRQVVVENDRVGRILVDLERCSELRDGESAQEMNALLDNIIATVPNPYKELKIRNGILTSPCVCQGVPKHNKRLFFPSRLLPTQKEEGTSIRKIRFCNKQPK
jgi:hypothetical protein